MWHVKPAIVESKVLCDFQVMTLKILQILKNDMESFYRTECGLGLSRLSRSCVFSRKVVVFEGESWFPADSGNVDNCCFSDCRNSWRFIHSSDIDLNIISIVGVKFALRMIKLFRFINCEKLPNPRRLRRNRARRKGR